MADASELRTPIAIVGAGQAAARAAQALRALGHAGAITMVGDEPHRPYERPPLSKAVLQADDAPATPVLPDAAFDDSRIDWLAGTRVQRLDPAARRLHLADGRTLHYERCLLATGGTARTLPALPPGAPRTHYLRTLDDARRLRASLRPGARLAVIGAGFLGLEAALSARRSGVEVTLVESAPLLLGRFVPAALSDWLARMVAGQGIALHLGQGLAAARADADAVHLRFADGAELAADAVLVAIGLVPAVDLARDAGLAIDADDGGIAVGPGGQTSDAAVFAAGDCASQFRTTLGRRARIESWHNANEQAAAAASGLLGLAPPAPAYPWFWTDPGEHNVQMLGLPAADLQYVCRGDPDAAGRALWLGLRDGVPVHGVALNTGGDLRALRPLFEQRVAIAPEAFAAEATALRPWVKARLAAAAAVAP
ncbi:MAG: FAD-dependent oxidoreductase [Proteobacteria bacterium]|nr:FAD-dependent oxidoreductase [Pseudomonadota bacterium]